MCFRDLFDPEMFDKYDEYLKSESSKQSKRTCSLLNSFNIQPHRIEEQVNLMDRDKTDDGVWFAVLIMSGLLVYIAVSAYEMSSRYKKATFEFIPDGLLPATCFSPNQ